MAPGRAAVLRVAGRAFACVLVAGILGLPLAFSWAVTHTEVVSQIGTSPTTFTLTTSGHSELRLGIAGTIYVPQTEGSVGIVATVDGPGDPGDGGGDLTDYVRPEMLELYAGLFHNPRAAVREYVALVRAELRDQLILAELTVAVAGGALLLGLSYILPWSLGADTRHGRLRLVVSGLLLLATTSFLGWMQVRTSDAGRDDADGVYALPVFDGTLAEGSTTNSPVLRAALGGAVAKARVLIQRQEEGVAEFRAAAERGLADQADAMEGPRDGELAVIMQSDMHCNTSMIHLQSLVVSMLKEEHGDEALSLLGITGDLTTNGTAAEGTCIRDEAAIADGMPIAAVIGNHESDVSAQQMADAGMTVLDGSIEELGGFRVLGDADPSRTELFGDSSLRGDETQEEQGARLFDEAADDERPDLVLVHEAAAAAAFLDVDSMGSFLDARGSFTSPVDDDVRDLPAGAVFYGHWHRSVDPRVVWNSDGTWTLVMELDTSGGAVGSSTINNFSTPWSRPLREASFPVVFLDVETRLVTSFQLYHFDTDGTVTVDPRVAIGAT